MGIFKGDEARDEYWRKKIDDAQEEEQQVSHNQSFYDENEEGTETVQGQSKGAFDKVEQAHTKQQEIQAKIH